MPPEARVRLVKAHHVLEAWVVREIQVQWEVLSSQTPSVPLLFLHFPGNSLSS